MIKGHPGARIEMCVLALHGEAGSQGLAQDWSQRRSTFQLSLTHTYMMKLHLFLPQADVLV